MIHSPSDVLIARYDYDGFHGRVKKTVGNVVTTSFYNAWWQELESTTAGQTTVNVWGLRYIDDLVLRERGNERLYSIADANWNVVAIANASGIIQERMRYDAFGRITWLNAAFATKENSDFGWNRTFTGQVLDAETGMMVYRNRFYHTGLGRFVHRDPIEYLAGDANLYRYVWNMPNKWVDPLGLIWNTVDRALGGIQAGLEGVRDFGAGAADELTFGGVGAAQRRLGFQQNQGRAFVAGGVAAAVVSSFTPAGAARQGARVVRGANRLRPNPQATGPHTTFRRDSQGNVTHYAEYTPNPRNPTGFDEVKRVDTQYANPHAHGNVPTPHVHTNQPPYIRSACPDELPR